jgi:hypothetical protein
VDLPSSIVDRSSNALDAAVEGAVAARELPRTTALHGVTWEEIKRFDGAVHFMQKYCKRAGGQLWWISTAHGSTRDFIDQVWKRLTNLQRAEDLPPYRAMTFETRGGLHSHIVFVGNRSIADRLQTSPALGDKIKVGKVYDLAGLSQGYLAKERTPQANYRRHFLGGRIKASHRLEGGGDRVRLSEQLKLDALEARYVEPWQPENAKRTDDRKEYRKRPLTRRAPRPSGQILLFPELSKPVARLHAFGGGIIPPPVAAEIEFRRRQKGWSQRQLAAVIGRSQGQLANALRGHDPISAAVVNRLRDVLLQEAAASGRPSHLK